MIKIENLSELGLQHIIMDLVEMIDSHCLEEQNGKGLQMENCWITPEGCYWLYRLIQNCWNTDPAVTRVREMLKNGTNHPEEL